MVSCQGGMFHYLLRISSETLKPHTPYSTSYFFGTHIAAHAPHWHVTTRLAGVAHLASYTRGLLHCEMGGQAKYQINPLQAASEFLEACAPDRKTSVKQRVLACPSIDQHMPYYEFRFTNYPAQYSSTTTRRKKVDTKSRGSRCIAAGNADYHPTETNTGPQHPVPEPTSRIARPKLETFVSKAQMSLNVCFPMLSLDHLTRPAL